MSSTGSERKWYYLRRVFIALVGLLVLGSAALQASAAFPTGSAASPPLGVPGQKVDPKSDPWGIASYDCANLERDGIAQQMNQRAGAILSKCMGTDQEKQPDAKEGTSGRTGVAAIDKLLGPLTGGVDIDMNVGETTNRSQAESWVWGNGNTIVVTYNDFRGITLSPILLCGATTSTDGGATFTWLPANTFQGLGQCAGDPFHYWSARAQKWFAGFFSNACGANGIGQWESLNGINWTPSGCTHTGSNDDRFSGWVDNVVGSPFFGFQYVIFSNFALTNAPLQAVRSTDDGVTWSAPVTLSARAGGGANRPVQITGSPGTDGTVFAQSMDEGGGGLAARDNYIHRSTDGGVTWLQIQQGALNFPAPGSGTCPANSFFAIMPGAPGNWRHQGWGQPGVGLNNVVHYAYAQHGAGADQGDIMYIRSTDNGSTWSAPIILNTDAPAGTRAQWMPSLAANVQGTVVVGWYDRRNTTGNDYQRFVRSSTDNGVTWQVDKPISDVIIPQWAAETSSAACYGGDYDYSTASNSNQGTDFYQTWNDGRVQQTGVNQMNVFFDKASIVGGPTATGTVPTATRTNTVTNTPIPPSATPTACAFTTVLTEGFEAGTLGAFTQTVIITSTTTPVPTPGWASVASNPHSGARSAFAPDPDRTTDSRLATTNSIVIPSGVSTATLSFWHRFSFENLFDGGVLEVSTDGGTTWNDADLNIQQGGYNGIITVFQGCITAGTPGPFPAGKRVWTGSMTTYAEVRVNLLPYVNTPMKFRFRLGTDCSVSNTGWNIDDVVVSYAGACATTTVTPIVSTSTRTNTATNTPVGATNTPTRTNTAVGATNTPGLASATPTACVVTYGYTVATGATIVPGTVDTGNHTDDGSTVIALPFAYTLYDQVFNNVAVGSNGHLTFGTVNNTFTPTCIPVATATFAVGPYWTDQCTGPCFNVTCPTCGIFTSTSGSAPNRIFNIEWRTAYYNSGGAGVPLNYEVRLFEGQTVFEIIYGTVNTFTPPAARTLSVGVQRASTGPFTLVGCDTTGGTAPPVSTGQRYTFTRTSGACPTNTPVGATNTPTRTNTAVGATNTPGGASPTPCVGGGTPGVWTNATPRAIDAYAPGGAGDATNFYLGAGYAFSLGGYTNQFARFSPSANTYTPLAVVPTTGEMISFVYSPLNNRIYAFGGIDCVAIGTAYNNTRIYDIGTGLWSAGTPMTIGAQQMASGYWNGKIYLQGGYTDCFISTAQAGLQIYDVATNTWTAGAPMPEAIGGGIGGVINGVFYVAGGRDAVNTNRTTVYAYTIATNTWATVASLPTGVNVAASGIQGGKLWVMGGGNPFLGEFNTISSLKSDNQLDTPNTTNITQIYDPATNSWTAGPNMNVARSFPAGGSVGNYVVVQGGYTGSTSTASTEVNLTTGGTCPTNTPVGATGTATRTNTAGVPSITPTVCVPGPAVWIFGPTYTPSVYAIQGDVAADGNFYTAGGQTGSNTPVPNVNRYNPGSNTWTALAPLPVAVGQAAVGISGTKMYVAGGFIGGTAITNTLQIYDITSNTWSFGPSMPAATEASAGVVLGNKFYVIGGDDFNVGLATNYVYDVVANSWTTAAPLPATRTNLNGTAAGGLVYVFGGAIGAGFTANDALLSYNPGTNTWTTLAPGGVAALGNYANISPYTAGNLIAAVGGSTTFVSSNRTRIYSIAGNSWTEGPLMNESRMAHAQGTLLDGRVIVATGLNTGTGTRTSTELLTSGGSCPTPSATAVGATNTPGLASPTICVGGTISQTGSITLSDPTQTGRLFRDGIASTCAAPKVCPGAFDAVVRHYDEYTYTNSSAGSVCVTVNMHVSTCVGTGATAIFGVVYNGTYNPAVLCTNYIADSGGSPNIADYPFSFTVAAGQTFVVVIHEVTANAGCPAYGFEVLGLPGGNCASPTPGTPVPTSTPTRTNTAGLASPTACVGGPPGAWTAATPYPQSIGRYGFAQVGSDFYVISGVDAGTIVNTVRRYNTGTGVWTTLAPIPIGLEAPACAYWNGFIYCGGGFDGSAGTTNFQIYNVGANTWAAGPAMTSASWGAAAGAAGNRVYIVGGDFPQTTTVRVFDIGTNTWSTGTPIPSPYILGGYNTVGSHLYVVGAYGAAPSKGEGANAVHPSLVNGTPGQVPSANGNQSFRLDMVAGTWTTGPAWTTARADFGLASDGTKLYAIAGDSNGGSFFDPTVAVDELTLATWPAGAWVASPPNLTTSSRQANQAGFGSAARIWTTGGISTGAAFIPNHEFRDTGGCATPGVATNTPGLVTATPTCVAGGGSWRTDPSMTTARRNAAMAVIGSNLYAATGFNAAPDYTAVLERFDGTSWTTLAPIPTPHAQSKGTSVGTKMYVPGGFNSVSFGGQLDSMQIYDSVANTWSMGAPMPAVRSGPAVASYNGKVYIIGGFLPGFVAQSQVWEYDPVANTYATKTSMPTTGGNMAGAELNGEIFVFGGSVAVSQAYNPTTDTWRPIAAFPQADCQSNSIFVLDGELWVVGCLNRPIAQQVYVYTPGTNAWRTGTPYISDHAGPGAALFQGRGYVVGGGAASGGSTAVESLGGGNCGTPIPTNTPGGTPPTATATACVANYTVGASTGATIVPGTTFLAGTSCDDCSVAFPLPFAFNFYGQSFNSVNVVSNGSLQFSSSDTSFTNACLPNPAHNNVIEAYWDDILMTTAGDGVYTSVSGSAPNRIVNIEWRGCYYSGGVCGGPVNVEARLYEGSGRIDVIYAVAGLGNSSATGGVQRGTGSLFLQAYCDGAGLPVSAGTMHTYNQGSCGSVTPSPTSPPVSTNTPGVGPSPTCAPSSQLIQDPSFEGGTPNAFWSEESTNFGTPLCDVASCGNGGGTAGPRTGSWWAWFGGTASVEDGAVEQTVNIPAGSATLQFYLWIGAHSGNGSADYIRALVNGVEVFRADDANTAYDAGFVLVSVDVSAQSGGSRVVRIEEHNDAGSAVFNASVDDVTVTGGGACVTPSPGTTSTSTNTPVSTSTATDTPVGVTNTATSTPDPTSTTTVPSATPTICVMKFEDVHPEDWFYGYVEWMYCNGIVSGYNTVPPCLTPGRTCYKPGNPTTRGQLAKIVVRAFQFPIDTTGGPHFEDVGTGHTFYQYVETAYNIGLIVGYPCGGAGEPCVAPDNKPYYRSNRSVTRGQITKIVVGGAILSDPGNWVLENPPTSTFEDVPVGSTFFRYIETAYSHNIIEGYPCGAPPAGPCVPPGNKPYFLPNADATRAQIAKITYLSVTYPPRGSDGSTGMPQQPAHPNAKLPRR